MERPDEILTEEPHALDSEEGHAYAWGGGSILAIILIVVLLLLIF